MARFTPKLLRLARSWERGSKLSGQRDAVRVDYGPAVEDLIRSHAADLIDEGPAGRAAVNQIANGRDARSAAEAALRIHNAAQADKRAAATAAESAIPPMYWADTGEDLGRVDGNVFSSHLVIGWDESGAAEVSARDLVRVPIAHAVFVGADQGPGALAARRMNALLAEAVEIGRAYQDHRAPDPALKVRRRMGELMRELGAVQLHTGRSCWTAPNLRAVGGTPLYDCDAFESRWFAMLRPPGFGSEGYAERERAAERARAAIRAAEDEARALAAAQEAEREVRRKLDGIFGAGHPFAGGRNCEPIRAAAAAPWNPDAKPPVTYRETMDERPRAMLWRSWGKAFAPLMRERERRQRRRELLERIARDYEKAENRRWRGTRRRDGLGYSDGTLVTALERMVKKARTGQGKRSEFPDLEYWQDAAEKVRYGRREQELSDWLERRAMGEFREAERRNSKAGRKRAADWYEAAWRLCTDEWRFSCTTQAGRAEAERMIALRCAPATIDTNIAARAA